MARILIVVSYAPSLLAFRGKLIKALADRNHDIHVCAPLIFDEDKFISFCSSCGVTAHSLHLSRSGLNPFSDVFAIASLAVLLIRLKPDFTLPFTIKPVIYIGLILRALGFVRSLSSLQYCPFITGLGFAFTPDSSGIYNRLVPFVARSLFSIALQRAAHAFFQNPDDISDFKSLNLLNSSTRVHRLWGSGVDLCEFRPTPLPAQPIFLMLSRLLVNKGVREYIESAYLVKRLYPNAVFMIAGLVDNGPSAVSYSLVQDAVKDNVLVYLGSLDSVQDAISSCRFYVLPSYREGTPRSTLEAMASARPIITTDVPGCRETIIHGFNGFLVKPRSSQSLATAIIYAISQPPYVTEEMASNSLNLVRSRYDVNHVNNTIVSLLGL